MNHPDYKKHIAARGETGTDSLLKKVLRSIAENPDAWEEVMKRPSTASVEKDKKPGVETKKPVA